MGPHLVSIDSGHHQSVGAQIWTQYLTILDGLADNIASVELWQGESPDDLWQEGEEGREDVGDGEVKDEEVHAGHLGPRRENRAQPSVHK